MDIINDFLHEFEELIFEEHLELIKEFKREYTNLNVYNKPCPHDDSSADVVGICGCCFFHIRKGRVMKIIEKYKQLIKKIKNIKEI